MPAVFDPLEDVATVRKEVHERVGVRSAFITGLVALLPLGITVIVLGMVWGAVIQPLSSPLAKALRYVVAWVTPLTATQIPEYMGTVAALILTVVFIYVLGRSLRGIAGRKVMEWTDGAFTRMPVVKFIYPHAKQLSNFLFGTRKVKFNRVVAIEYPRKGIFTLGFVTSAGIEEISLQQGRRMLAVFVPTSPTPFTGWTVLVDEREVMPLNMSVDQAVRFAVTCGVILPEAPETQTLPAMQAAALPPEE